MNVHIECSQCSKDIAIDRDIWERYYQDDEESFICNSCQLDIFDGYLRLDPKTDKYGRTGEQQDNSLGTF